jgi:hypothetical protein
MYGCGGSGWSRYITQDISICSTISNNLSHRNPNNGHWIQQTLNPTAKVQILAAYDRSWNSVSRYHVITLVPFEKIASRCSPLMSSLRSSSSCPPPLAGSGSCTTMRGFLCSIAATTSRKQFTETKSASQEIDRETSALRAVGWSGSSHSLG